MKIIWEMLYLTIIPKDLAGHSLDKLSTSGKLRDGSWKRGMRASMRESQGKGRESWNHGAKGSRGTQQQDVSCHSPQNSFRIQEWGSSTNERSVQNKPPPSSALGSSSAKDCSKATFVEPNSVGLVLERSELSTGTALSSKSQI